MPVSATEFATQYINPQSIYRMTVCDEVLARAAASGGRHAPVNSWEVRHLLGETKPETVHPAAADVDGEQEDDSEDEDEWS